MKDKIKDWLLVIAYFVCMFLIFGFFESDFFQESTIGNIIMTLGAIAMICLFLYLGYVSIVAIYISIKDWFKRQIRSEARKLIAEERYLERQRSKGENNEKN